MNQELRQETAPSWEHGSIERRPNPPSATGNSLRLRRARPEDAPVAARLIYATLGPMADYLLGADKADRAVNALSRLFTREANRFSYQFTTVAERTEDVCGLLTAYSYRTMQQLRLSTAHQILRACGVLGLVRFIWRSIPLMGIQEAEPGQYFIDAVAVLPEMRGQGIGTQLLHRAEVQALKLGLTACALTVEINNERARRLYARLGYQIVEAIHMPSLARHLGYGGLYRMVKLLDVT